MTSDPPMSDEPQPGRRATRAPEAGCSPGHYACLRCPLRLLPHVVAAILLWAALSAVAQQIGQNAPLQANQTPVLKVTTELVVETVSVKDKNGKPVEGLTAKDFTVTENAVPQTIAVFQYEQLPQASGVKSESTSAPNIRIYDKLARTRISPE